MCGSVKDVAGASGEADGDGGVAGIGDGEGKGEVGVGGGGEPGGGGAVEAELDGGGRGVVGGFAAAQREAVKVDDGGVAGGAGAPAGGVAGEDVAQGLLFADLEVDAGAVVGDVDGDGEAYPVFGCKLDGGFAEDGAVEFAVGGLPGAGDAGGDAGAGGAAQVEAEGVAARADGHHLGDEGLVGLEGEGAGAGRGAGRIDGVLAVGAGVDADAAQAGGEGGVEAAEEVAGDAGPRGAGGGAGRGCDGGRGRHGGGGSQGDGRMRWMAVCHLGRSSWRPSAARVSAVPVKTTRSCSSMSWKAPWRLSRGKARAGPSPERREMSRWPGPSMSWSSGEVFSLRTRPASFLKVGSL